MSLFWSLLSTLVLLLLVALAVLLARRAVDRMEEQVGAEPWKTLLVGLLAQILFLPLLVLTVIVLVISIVGIPLLVLLPFALLALLAAAIAGFAAVAMRVGRWLSRRFAWQLGSPWGEILVGLVLIQIWTIVGKLFDLGRGPIAVFAAMLLFAGFMAKYLAWTTALGAVLLTRFGTTPGPLRLGGSTPLPPTPYVPPGEPLPPPLPTQAHDTGAGRRSIFEGETLPEPESEMTPVVSGGTPAASPATDLDAATWVETTPPADAGERDVADAGPAPVEPPPELPREDDEPRRA
jgi:hypothetical protein